MNKTLKIATTIIEKLPMIMLVIGLVIGSYYELISADCVWICYAVVISAQYVATALEAKSTINGSCLKGGR